MNTSTATIDRRTEPSSTTTRATKGRRRKPIRESAERRLQKAFGQVPTKVLELNPRVRGFFVRIVLESNYDRFTTISVKKLAELEGITRKDAFKYMAILRGDIKLVDRRQVDGVWYTYHADQHGVLTLPCDQGARHPEVAQAPPVGGAPALPPSLISTRVVFVETGEADKNGERGFASAKQDEKTHTCTSPSSFFASSPQETQTPKSTNRTAPRIPLASAMPATPALTPRVRKVNLLDVPEPVIDLALVAVLVALGAADAADAEHRLAGWAKIHGMAKVRATVVAAEGSKTPIGDIFGWMHRVLHTTGPSGPPPPKARPKPSPMMCDLPPERRLPDPDYEPLPKGFDWRKFVKQNGGQSDA